MLLTFHPSKVSTEACPLGLAPTASSALMLAIGDAIAISLFQLKGFTAEDFLKSHPGGALGKNKFIKIKEVMRSINEVPVSSLRIRSETYMSGKVSMSLGSS